MKRHKLAAVLLLSVCVGALCVGCRLQNSGQGQVNKKTAELVSTEASEKVMAMDTYMTMTAYGERSEEAVAHAKQEILRLEQLLSPTGPDSEVAKLNAQGNAVVSDDVLTLLEQSKKLWESTGGVFDITIYPLMNAWGFPAKEYRVPAKEELEQLLPLVDASAIDLDVTTKEVSFRHEGMQLDFGGIAKGYTSARIMELFQEYGIESGIVNLGGNVQVLGKKPDGTNWRVAVQSPDGGDEYLGIVSVCDCAIITSGAYQRNFEEAGKTYHHILNPSTGYPANSGLRSATIISSDGAVADGLSTACFIMGAETASAYWRANSGMFDMILLTDDNRLLVTEGIAEEFTSDYSMEIIKKDE